MQEYILQDSMHIKQAKSRCNRKGIRPSEASSELWIDREWFGVGGVCKVTVVSIGTTSVKLHSSLHITRLIQSYI